MPRTMVLRELRSSLLILVGVVVVGVLGFRFIEGWSWLESLWMAVITVTTIGFGEVHQLSTVGRIFTLVYIMLAVGAATYAVARLTGYIMDGSLGRALRARRRERHMRELREHYIVVGFGRLGREVTEDLHHEGARVVVIDPKAEVADLVPEGVFFVQGDGSSDAVLREAGIERARAIAVATPSSAVNVFVTLSVRHLNPTAQIITRVDEPDAEPKALRAGANTVISPFTSAGNRMSHQLLRPHAAQFVEQMLSRTFRELLVDDVAVSAGVVGSLSELRLRDRFGIGVIAIRRPQGELITVPAGDVRIAVGDIVVVVGSESAIGAFRTAVAG